MKTNLIRPSRIRLEASSACQLRCPSCPTTTKATRPVIGAGLLKLSDFCQLIEQNPWVREIELSNYGEIFLNPDLPAMLAFAAEHNVILNCANGSNLNILSDAALDAIVRYGLKSISCSIDGASQETYERYRVRGNFERVIENIRRINAYKEIFQTPYPVLTWQFVIFGHNEHEITKAREMARSLNMHFSPKLTWDPHFSPIKNIEKVKQDAMLPEATREEFKEKKGTDYVSGICAQLWLQPQVNWDGKMLGCCRNFWGDFGDNVYSHGLLESINGEKMRYARKMLMGEAAPREDIPCTTCDIYTQRQSSQEWMTVNFF